MLEIKEDLATPQTLFFYPVNHLLGRNLRARRRAQTLGIMRKLLSRPRTRKVASKAFFFGSNASTPLSKVFGRLLSDLEKDSRHNRPQPPPISLSDREPGVLQSGAKSGLHHS